MVGPRYLIGESSVGQKVVDHLPDSWDWKIQLWSLDDCLEFCSDELNPNGRYTIKWLEPIMIQKLRPSLNVMYNLNPGIDHTPTSDSEKRHEAELDRAFREIFEKRDSG